MRWGEGVWDAGGVKGGEVQEGGGRGYAWDAGGVKGGEVQEGGGRGYGTQGE